MKFTNLLGLFAITCSLVSCGPIPPPKQVDWVYLPQVDNDQFRKIIHNDDATRATCNRGNDSSLLPVILKVKNRETVCQFRAPAEAVATIVTYYSTETRGCEVVTKAGKNLEAGLCCTPKRLVCDYTSDGKCDLPGMEFNPSTLLAMYSVSADETGVLKKKDIVRELTALRPILIGISPSYPNHLAVIYGYRPAGFAGGIAVEDVFMVADPYLGRLELTYSELVGNYYKGGKWSKSWTHIRPKGLCG